MNEERIGILKSRIKSLTEELNECIGELTSLIDGDVPETGATDEDMGIGDHLLSLIDRKG